MPYQVDDYYPFGLEISRTPYIPKNEYLYNRKELQEELTQYDYGARFYDPVIARWTTSDPLAEKSRRFSPYVYGLNNPVRMIDPDGMEAEDGDDDPNRFQSTSIVREAGFALRHPLIAMQIGSVEHNSTNISTDAARFAINTGLNDNDTKEGTEVNAMRHATFQATLTSDFGKDIATQVGNAHEDDPHVDLTQRTFAATNGTGEFSALGKADQTVDLLNNIVGRQIGSDNKGASMLDLAKASLNEFHTNGLYTATVNKDGSVTIGKQKLTDKEYNSAMKNLNNTNANGFTPAQQAKKDDEERNRVIK